MPLIRRLTAILAADVAGYSRLMEVDEERTHESLRAHFREVVEPRIREHHGRIVKSAGDGMLAEFSSVIEAVLCAIETQCLMSRRNADVPDDERISFRIGVNLGDVIAEMDDIFGDGVNVAARLQTLAEPNGICISEIVHDQVRNKVPVTFEDFGQKTVKNIVRPLHVFVLRPEVIGDLPIADEIMSYRPATQVGGYLLAQTPRLSVVVLPFANFSDGAERQYLVDAITDDVTTDLSRIADIAVISRNTADTYRGKSLDTRQIGRELNVRYVLKGSVRSTQDQIRVNTQLSDAGTDTMVWADRFNYASTDLFHLQDEVTSRIAIALNLELISAEAARPTSNPDALDHLLRGRAALDHRDGSTPERLIEAIGRFESALAFDPAAAATKAYLGLALATRALDQLSMSPKDDIERAEQLIEQALVASPRNAVAHFARGQLLRAEGDYNAAIPEYEAAIAVGRNWVGAIASLGMCKLFAGELDATIRSQELAIRLSPRDPRLPNWYWRIGMVHLLQSRFDEAILWLDKARIANPTLPGPHAWLASAFALTGKDERATAALVEACRLSPDQRYTSIERFETIQSLGSEKTRSLFQQTFLVGLRKAGVPER